MTASLPASAARSVEMLVLASAIFTAPFIVFQHSVVFLTLSDLCLMICLPLTLLAGRFPLQPLGRATGFWLIGCCLMLFGIIASSLLSAAPERSLIVAGQYAFAYVVMIFLLAGRDEVSTHRLVEAFVAGITINNLIGALVFAFELETGYPIVTGGGRMAAFLMNPNANANMIGLTVPFVLYLWMSGHWSRWLACLVLLILAVALIMTASANGLAATLLGILAFFTAAGWRPLLKMLLVAGCAGIVGVGIWSRFDFVLPEIFERRVAGALESGDVRQAGTFESRLDLMVEAVDVVDETMLLGLGADQYREISVHGAPVHNVYLLLWAEGGLPALVGWLALMTVPVFGAIAIYRRGDQNRILVASLGLAVITVFLLGAMNTAHRYGRYWAVPLELALALLFLPDRPRATHRRGAAAAPTGDSG